MRYLFTALIPLVFIICSSCSTDKKETAAADQGYKPDDQSLYDTIVHLDSLFFHYYNTCDSNLDKYAAFYADTLEFYHDKGGFDNSRESVIEGTRKNVCGKVTRELLPGSIEVYPIKGYGAVEMGLHKFHNRMEKEVTPAHAGKFVVLWRHLNNDWKITRVISLH
jgi:hypothetical protein